MLTIIHLVFSLLTFTLPLTLSAGERHTHSSAGLGGSGLPLYVAKSAGIFEKYGLDVDRLVIPGAARSECKLSLAAVLIPRISPP